MVAAECLYLANYKAGCRIAKLFYNNEQVFFQRAYIAQDSDDPEAQKKKFKIEEFMKNSREAAKELLNENMAQASRYLMLLLEQFNFRMSEDQRILVLKRTLVYF
jgi:ATP-dependent Zn protease